MKSKILSISEVANILQLSISTCYKYSTSGKLPSFHLGQRLRFLESEINDYIEKTIFEQRNKSTNENVWKF